MCVRIHTRAGESGQVLPHRLQLSGPSAVARGVENATLAGLANGHGLWPGPVQGPERIQATGRRRQRLVGQGKSNCDAI